MSDNGRWDRLAPRRPSNTRLPFTRSKRSFECVSRSSPWNIPITLCTFKFCPSPAQSGPNVISILCSNRDEHLARPAQPASWGGQQPDILAGIDVQAGGTWLGLSRTGKLALLCVVVIVLQCDRKHNVHTGPTSPNSPAHSPPPEVTSSPPFSHHRRTRSKTTFRNSSRPTHATQDSTSSSSRRRSPISSLTRSTSRTTVQVARSPIARSQTPRGTTAHSPTASTDTVPTSGPKYNTAPTHSRPFSTPSRRTRRKISSRSVSLIS